MQFQWAGQKVSTRNHWFNDWGTSLLPHQDLSQCPAEGNDGSALPCGFSPRSKALLASLLVRHVFLFSSPVFLLKVNTASVLVCVYVQCIFKQRDFWSCVSSIFSGNLPHLIFEAPIVSFPEVNLARISQSIFFPIWGRAEINHVPSLSKMHLLEVDINRFFINLIKNSLKTEMEDVVQSTDMSTGTSAWSPMRLTCFHTWQATQFDANHNQCSSSLAN